jgi:hypothetical protein
LAAAWNESARFWLDIASSIRYATITVAHEIAKLMLEHAGTFLERAEAIHVALNLGMPLREIEEYLDWLDATRGPLHDSSDGGSEVED